MLAARFLVLLLCAYSIVSCYATLDELVTELIELRERHQDNVIVLSSDLFTQYVLRKERSYALAVYLSARMATENRGSGMKELRDEFAIAATAYATGEDSSKIFFVELAYESGMDLFRRMGVEGLPFVFLWLPAQIAPRKDGKITIPAQNKFGSGAQAFPWPAEYFAGFTKARTGLKHAAIKRPTMFESPYFWAAAAVAAVLGGIAAYFLYRFSVFHHPLLWLGAALAVYWFASSGGLYNIIRKMPMYTTGQDGKIRWFLESNEAQLGLEGFAIGSLYLLLSYSLAFLVYSAPKYKTQWARALLSVLATLTAVVAGLKVFDLHHKKTGYSLRHFLY